MFFISKQTILINDKNADSLKKRIIFSTCFFSSQHNYTIVKEKTAMVQICVKTDSSKSKMCKYATVFNVFAVSTRCLFLPRNLTAALPRSYHRTVISPPDGHSIVKVRLRVYEPLTSLRGIYVPNYYPELQIFTNCLFIFKTPSIGRQRENEKINL